MIVGNKEERLIHAVVMFDIRKKVEHSSTFRTGRVVVAERRLQGAEILVDIDPALYQDGACWAVSCCIGIIFPCRF